MPIYKYKAVDAAGKYIESMQNAATKEQLLEMIRSKSWMPVSIDEYSEGRDISFDIFSKAVSVKDIAVFSRQFYTMLNAGVPIVGILDVLRQQTENKRLCDALNTVYSDVQTGTLLSESLKKTIKVFPNLFINMLDAGEQSGNMDVIMQRLAVHYEKEAKINAKVKNAMIYPVILIVAVAGVVTGLLAFVFPTFISLFTDSGIELPLPTKILMAVSNSITSYWHVYIIAVLILVFVFQRFSKTDFGARLIDGAKLEMPIFGKSLKKIISSRFTRTLSTLISSGISLIHALDMASKIVGNKVVEDKINEAKEQVRRGVDLSVPIRESGVFSPMLCSMIMVGEESGTLDEVLEKTADFYDAEVEAAMQAMVAAVEPILIVLMAVVVGFIVIALFLPMFDMMTVVQ